MGAALFFFAPPTPTFGLLLPLPTGLPSLPALLPGLPDPGEAPQRGEAEPGLGGDHPAPAPPGDTPGPHPLAALLPATTA